MIWIVLLSFFVSTLGTLGVLASGPRHRRWSADHQLGGPQKLHGLAVPRVGGVGVAAGLVAGALLLGWLSPPCLRDVAVLLLCAAPTLAVGLVEDVTKSVRPRWRLVAPALSGLLGAVLLQAIVVRTGWHWFDSVFAYPGTALALTMFTTAGVANSLNIIDGMNGLASMCALLMLAAIAYVALRCDDTLVAGIALATGAAALGFFVWNYPRGLIFLGDGGACLLGVMVAETGLLLIHRRPQVSPLAPLMVVAYPAFETVFSMYRRRVVRGRPVSMPDGIHLHTLIYRRVMRWDSGRDDLRACLHGNSRTSPLLWGLTALSLVPVLLWWEDTGKLALSIVAFALLYLHVYWRLVRFRTPWWLRGRRPHR